MNRSVLIVIGRLVACIWLFMLSGCFSKAPVLDSATSGAYASTTPDGEGAVATVNPIATKIGLDIYKSGGNAIDAAVAVAFALGVVDSHNSGIGGGAFILVRLEGGEVLAIDGREMAPALAHRDMFIRNGKAESSLSKTGALAVGIPGSVAALYELHKQAGKLSFSEVIQPSIKIARTGFAIDAVLAARLKRTANKIAMFPDTKAIFSPNGQVLKQSEILVQNDLANTYELLAKLGPTYFYEGAFAQAADKWMVANNGFVRAEDFAAYEVKYRQPISSQFNGFEVLGFPPPSSGGIHVAQILSMLSHLDVKDMNELQRYHSIIEVSKRAFSDRAKWLGDADFVSVPTGLLNESYLLARAKEVSADTVSLGVKAGLPPHYEDEIFNKHTTHLATADSRGNWVAMTSTLNTSFGSGVVIPGTGVLMNNQMDDFTAQPGVPNAFGLIGAEANAVAPKKRPLSSMSPTIILKDGSPIMTVGAAGGPTIISQVAQTILNHLLLEMPLAEAMYAPRVHHQWSPQVGFIDGHASRELKEGLESKGHQLKTWPRFGATQAISLGEAGFDAEAEPRIQR